MCRTLCREYAFLIASFQKTPILKIFLCGLTRCSDVEKIWLSVSDHIEESLVNQIGIRINKLGTFTLKRIELYIGRKDLS